MTTVLWRFFFFSLLILSILVLYIGTILTGLNLYADKLDAKADVLRRECIVRINQKHFDKLWYLTLHPNSDYKKDDLTLIEGDTLNNLGTVSPAIIDQWAREYEVTCRETSDHSILEGFPTVQVFSILPTEVFGRHVVQA